MQHYNHLGIFDFMYTSNLENLLDSFNNDFCKDTDDVILFKVISSMLFFSDYENLPEQFKTMIDLIRPKYDEYKNQILKLLGQSSKEELIRLLKSDDEDISLNNKFELFIFLLKFKKETTVSESFIGELINQDILPMYFLIQHKSVVDKNESLIKGKLLEEPGYIELFINEHDLANNRKEKRYFPHFTDDEVNNWIIQYLNSKQCNYNYVKGLSLHKDNEQTYSIYPRTRVLVKKKLKTFEEEILNGENAISKGCQILIEKGLGIEEAKIINRAGLNLEIKISADWIDANQDNPTLLNNLLSICDLCDVENRVKDTYNSHNESSLSRALTTRYKSEYGSINFSYMEGVKQTLFNAYITNLRHHWKIHIEDLYKWFVEAYLKEEFGIAGVNITLYKEESPYHLKGENIFIQIEHLLRQYAVYVENGEFSQELFESTKKSYKFEAYPSLIKDKYLIINDDSKLPYILQLLFSDQSRLNYIDQQKNDKNFLLLITNNNLAITDFIDYQQGYIKYLIEEGILVESKRKFIKPKNQSLALLMFDLYSVGFLNYKNINNSYMDYVNEFYAKGWLSRYNGLFCKQEADYLSYYFDNSKFSNAIAVRNYYEHGNSSFLTEEKHMENYLIGLRLLGIVIIKINDDLRQKFD